jgi:hypothetical protein
MSLLTTQSAINPNKNFWLSEFQDPAIFGTILADSISTINLQALNEITGTNITAQNLVGDLLVANDANITDADITTLSTSGINLDGAVLTTVNGTELLLNGLPIATTDNLSSIQDWATFPAISTITMANAQIDIGSLAVPVREGYFSTIYANNAQIVSTILVPTEVVSSLFVDTEFVSTSFVGRLSASTAQIAQLQVSSINNLPISNLNASNWALFPAVSNVNMNGNNLQNANEVSANAGRFVNAVTLCNPSLPNAPDIFVSIQDVGFGLFQTDTDEYTSFSGSLITSRNGGGNDQTQINGQNVTITGGALDTTTINGGDISTRNLDVGDIVTEQADVTIYGRNLPPGDNALYVSGGFTQEGGFTHGASIGCAGVGTYPVSLMLNRIDLLPIGAQLYTTFGAIAMNAGLGITINAGLGINLASGLALDLLSQDVTLRANTDISLDADENIPIVAGGTISMNANNISMTANNLTQNTANFTFNDNNFTVNSSNANTLNATKTVQGTVLPPSTIGFYSTINQTSQIYNDFDEALMTAQRQFGLYQNISSVDWVVTSNISTIFSTSVSSILSSFTSTFTSSFVRSYSTLAILQDFPLGQVSVKPSSLTLQHADKIELDTKPFPIFTSLTPGLSSIVSSLYSYEAITDGSFIQEIGQITQTIFPVTTFLSSFELSTGVSSGTVLSTLLSSVFSTLTSEQTFTSSIFNLALFDTNAFSTPAILASTINEQQLPYSYGSFTANTTQTVLGASVATPVLFDTTEFANGVTLLNPSSIQVQRSGLWRILASPQFDTTSAGLGNLVYFWLTKNGSNVERTASQLTIANQGEVFTSVEILQQLSTNETIGVSFGSTDTGMGVYAYPGTAFAPSTPAVILNINQLTS